MYNDPSLANQGHSTAFFTADGATNSLHTLIYEGYMFRTHPHDRVLPQKATCFRRRGPSTAVVVAAKVNAEAN